MPAWQMWHWATGLMVLGAILLVLSVTAADPDLWGHVRFGLDMLESRELARVDPYSYLSGPQPWINHEWLAELFFALAWRAAGPTGLILLKMAVGSALIGLLYAHLVRGMGSSLRAAVLVMLGMLLMIPALGTVRPHMFTLLGFTVACLIIYQAGGGDLRWLWATPPLFALWVNLHGGVLAGLGLMSFWALLHLWQNWTDWRRVLPPVSLGFTAIVLNPYGLELPAFLLRTATVRRAEIVEWAPLQLTTVMGAVYLMLLAATVASLIISRRTRKAPVLILFGLTALMPFVAIRHLPLFGIAALAFTGEHVGSAWERMTPVRAGRERRLPVIWLAIAPLFTGIGLLLWMTTNLRAIPMPVRYPRFPVQAVEVIKRSGVVGNIVVDFNWGEYVIWHLGPKVQVSMDGRRETVYSEKVYREYWDFILGRENWEALLTSYETDLVLVEPGAAAYHLLVLSPGWELVFEDQVSGLFQRQDSPVFEKSVLEARGSGEEAWIELFP